MKQTNVAHLPWLLLAAVMGLLSGCSASKNGDKLSSFAANVGTATRFDFLQKSVFVLGRHQYFVLRNEESLDMIYLETQWRERQPFADELEKGILEAKSRIILRATPRSRAAIKTSELNTIRLTAENMVRFSEEHDWTNFPLTPMAKAYFEQLGEDLETEFRTGIRKF